MSATLENMLETACATLARACEPAIADDAVSVRLATELLDQPPSPEAEEGADAADITVPYIQYRAKLEPNDLSHAGYFDVPLTIEVGDNAGHASEDGYLDRLFRAAARLFFYAEVTDESVNPPVTRPLFDKGFDANFVKGALSLLVDGLCVLGLKPDSISTDMENEGSIVKRMITGTFVCGHAAT